MPPVIQAPKQFKFKMKRATLRRRFTDQQKFHLITLVDSYQMTFTQIAKEYRLNRVSVKLIYNTYKANGNQIVNNMHKAGRKKYDSTLKVIELVKKPGILQQWNTLTLAERCE